MCPREDGDVSFLLSWILSLATSTHALISGCLLRSEPLPHSASMVITKYYVLGALNMNLCAHGSGDLEVQNRGARLSQLSVRPLLGCIWLSHYCLWGERRKEWKEGGRERGVNVSVDGLCMRCVLQKLKH